MNKNGRILDLCCVYVDKLLVTLDESKSETRQHFVVLDSTVPTGSREDTEYIIICDVYFRPDFCAQQME